ncbi:hypothetical protein DEO72_LG1g2301 [Vigna unguiculata]|uniref:Uncharacterized protein n=1 Tax=Vigna unguiculata TaxID=3917 RepID=A0A4D6KPZ9_VIGUN|nr:hypothetical protein DEO72_LG1g2301 [Vigna unguiculata]
MRDGRAPWMRDSADPMVTLLIPVRYKNGGSRVKLLPRFPCREDDSQWWLQDVWRRCSCRWRWWLTVARGAVEMEKRGDGGARCLAVVGNGDGCCGGSWWRLGFEEN